MVVAPLQRKRAVYVVVAIPALGASLALGACSSSSSADSAGNDAAIQPFDAGHNALVDGAGPGGQDAHTASDAAPDSGSGTEAGTDASGVATPRDPAYDGIYVPDGPSVRVFALAAHGNVAPIRTLSGTSTMLSVARVAAVDSIGQVFVANEDRFGSSATLVYPSLTSGNVAPLRMLGVSGGMAGNAIVGLAIGPSDDLWAAQYNAYHFPANATASDGAIASGPDLAAIAMTALGDVVLATSGGSVATYAAAAGASTAIPTPIRTLVTGKTIRAIAVASDTIFVLESTGAIDAFAASTSGTATPAATISAPTTASQTATAIAVDSTASPPVLYVAAYDTTGTIYEVTLAGSSPAYTAGATVSLQGPLTTLTTASSVFVVHY
jgi:hypothetical protein